MISSSIVGKSFLNSDLYALNFYIFDKYFKMNFSLRGSKESLSIDNILHNYLEKIYIGQ